MGLGDYIKNELSNELESSRQVRSSKKFATAEEESIKRQKRNELVSDLKEKSYELLHQAVESATSKASEIREIEVPNNPQDYIAYYLLCDKNRKMQVKECGANLCDDDNDDVDFKKPDKILKQAWENKFKEVSNYGRSVLIRDPQIVEFFHEVNAKNKANRNKIVLASVVGLSLLLLIIGIVYFTRQNLKQNISGLCVENKFEEAMILCDGSLDLQEFVINDMLAKDLYEAANVLAKRNGWSEEGNFFDYYRPLLIKTAQKYCDDGERKKAEKYIDDNVPDLLFRSSEIEDMKKALY